MKNTNFKEWRYKKQLKKTKESVTIKSTYGNVSNISGNIRTNRSRVRNQSY